MHYVQRKVSELYPVKDIVTVLILLATVPAVGITLAGIVTTLR